MGRRQGPWVPPLKGHTDSVYTVAFSRDGRYILTGSFDKTAKVWDADNGEELFSLKGHTHEVFSVAFSPDGRRILTGSNDRTVKVWKPQWPGAIHPGDTAALCTAWC